MLGRRLAPDQFRCRTLAPPSGSLNKVSFFLSIFMLFNAYLPDLHFPEIKPGSIERKADKILGRETTTEYKHIKQKLGGTHANRIFQFYGIAAPSRVAAAKHKNAEAKKKGKLPLTGSKTPKGGKLITSHLEQEKKQSGGKPG